MSLETADWSTFGPRLVERLKSGTSANGGLSADARTAARALACHSPAHPGVSAALAGDALSGDDCGQVLTWMGAVAVTGRAGAVKEAWYRRGEAAMALARDEVVTSAANQLLALDAKSWRAHALRAVSRGEGGDLTGGLLDGRRAVLLAPEQSGPVNNLLSLTRAAPDNPVWRWLACLAPDNLEARYHRAACLLTHGRWAEGWPAYRVRLGLSNYRDYWRHRSAPDWTGDSAIDRLLILPDEGLGDQLRCLGYLRAARQHAGAVSLVLNARLRPIARRNFPKIRVLSREQADAEEFDGQIPMGDLGRLGAHVQCPLLSVTAPPRPGKARPQVGIAWSGGVDPRLRRQRGIDPTLLVAALRELDVDLVSLQHAPDPAEVRKLRDLGVIFDPAIDPFGPVESYAAAIAGLDAVASVSNSAVHLAGALGAKAHCLVPYFAQWYWALDANGRLDYTAHWYPSVTIHRQHAPMDWSNALARLVAALSKSLIAP